MQLNLEVKRDLIRDIELSFDIEGWQFAGMNCWPWLRFVIMNSRVQNLSTSTSAPSNVRLKASRGFKLPSRFFLSLFREFLKSIYQGVVFYLQVNRKTEVLFLSHSTSRNLIENTWYDMYVDPLRGILDEMGIGSTALEFIAGNDKRVPTFRKTLWIDFLAVRSKFIAFFLSLFSPNFRGYKELVSFIKARQSDICLPTELQLKRQLIEIFLFTKFFERYLARCQPRICFQVTYYTALGVALNIACARQKVISVDLQHGVHGDMHAAYGNWSNVPSCGYEMLPNFFWTWRKADCEALDKVFASQTQKHRGIVGGNIWLENFELVSNGMLEKARAHFRVLAGEKSSVLVTLQPRNLDVGLRIDDILKLMESIGDQVFWWIRLHPSMWMDLDLISKKIQTSRQLSQNYNLKEATEYPLPTLLHFVDLHLTESSSTILEASSIGLLSIALSDQAATMYPAEVENGDLIVARNLHEVTNFISSFCVGSRSSKRAATSHSVSALTSLLSFHSDNSRI